MAAASRRGDLFGRHVECRSGDDDPLGIGVVAERAIPRVP
jgi:hypothetical protein